MIVHPNPMIKTGSGCWTDTHFQQVEVRPLIVNWGNHRQRWAVYAARRANAPLLFISRHITAEQAIVSAQTLANRLKRLKDKKVRRRKTPTLVISPAERAEVNRLVREAFALVMTDTTVGKTQHAQEDARQAIRHLTNLFQLKR